MAVPTAITDLSTTAGSNSPSGAESASTTDDYLRALSAFVAQLYAGTSNGQIVFPATQNASANANTLDDYKEGTWTPTVSAASGTITTYSATGHYTKIGNRVFCSIDITITTKGTAASSMTVTLPFAAGFGAAGAGIESASSGKAANGFVAASSSTSTWILYDGTTPFLLDGMRWYLNFSYRV